MASQFKSITGLLLAAGLTISLASCNKGIDTTPLSFEITVSEESDESALISIRPSENGREFAYAVIASADYTSDEDLVSSASEATTISDKLVNKYANGLDADTEYIVYAFETRAADPQYLQKASFRTLPAEDVFSCSIAISESTAVSIGADITAVDDDAGFYFGVIEKEYYASMGGGRKAIQAQFEQDLIELGKIYEYYSREAIIKEILAYGKGQYRNIRLKDGTEYYLWACSMDMNGILTAKPNILAFTSKEYIPSDAVATGFVDKYYDGDDAAEISYEYGYVAGYCIFPIWFEKNGAVKDYYMNIYHDEDLEGLSDIDIISDMLEKNFVNIDSGNLYFCQWEPVTVCCIGIDSDGNFGPLCRNRYEFEKNKVSDVHDILEESNTAKATRI